ncbi:MAG: hypothetical protein OXQ29_18105, partial [Rhodospirillaceae bacterium]|nr:hypothetical protein [Rhodospirillaceae bacterium]
RHRRGHGSRGSGRRPVSRRACEPGDGDADLSVAVGHAERHSTQIPPAEAARLARLLFESSREQVLVYDPEWAFGWGSRRSN